MSQEMITKEQFHLSMHHKAIELLEMSLRAKDRLAHAKKRLDTFEKSNDPYEGIRLWETREGLEEKIAHANALHQRIYKSYWAKMEKIILNIGNQI